MHGATCQGFVPCDFCLTCFGAHWSMSLRSVEAAFTCCRCKSPASCIIPCNKSILYRHLLLWMSFQRVRLKSEHPQLYLRITSFWDVTPCDLADTSHIFKWAPCAPFNRRQHVKSLIILTYFRGYGTCLLPQGKNTGWGCSRIGCWGRYVGLRGTK